MYDIPRHRPDDLFLEARDFAGRHIQQLMNKTPDDFAWIRSELTAPAFDDMNFRYKNQVFSVLVKIFHNGREITPPHRQELFLQETKKYNMIPCIFPVNLNLVATESKYGYGVVIEPGKIPKHEFTPIIATEWNLSHAETGAPINPLNMASDEPVLMSEYELQNFAIRVVINQLKKDGIKLESFCDIPGIVPQLWFQDSNGKICWVYVQYGPDKSKLTPPDLSEISKQASLNKYDGYFAPVALALVKEKPYRGSGFYVNYSGLMNIFKA